MKNLCTATICVCITLSGLSSSAQNQKIPINQPDYNKPMLFASLPDKIPVSTDNLNSLFSVSVGKQVSVVTTDTHEFKFDGEVVSAASKYENRIQSLVIRSTNYNGANFTVSRITNAQGLVSYTGRIISMQHGDLYELKKEADNFVLVKRKFYDLVNE